jgi:hypothetical protein
MCKFYVFGKGDCHELWEGGSYRITSVVYLDMENKTSSEKRWANTTSTFDLSGNEHSHPAPDAQKFMSWSVEWTNGGDAVVHLTGDVGSTFLTAEDTNKGPTIQYGVTIVIRADGSISTINGATTKFPAFEISAHNIGTGDTKRYGYDPRLNQGGPPDLFLPPSNKIDGWNGGKSPEFSIYPMFL